MQKVQYACTGKDSDGKECKKLSTWRYPYEFSQNQEKYMCKKCSKNTSEVKQRQLETNARPDVKQRRSDAGRIAQNRPGVNEQRLKSAKITNARPESKQKRSVACKIAQNTPHAKQQHLKTNARLDVKQRKSEAQKLAQNRPEVKQKKANSLKITNARMDVKSRRSQSGKTAQKKRFKDPAKYERVLQRLTSQGFWYGHPILHQENKRKRYCELWNKDLWVRIDAAWDYKSAISEVTRWETPSKRQLSRHHVYWQEKACCEWDEDKQGYFAMIDLNHNKNNPNWYKHYIKGDPNKFVLLTEKEHGIIKGSKKSGKTLLDWVIYFEDLIEKREAEGKPCYLSKEDYEVYKVENADKIAYYTQKVPKVVEADDNHTQS